MCGRGTTGGASGGRHRGLSQPAPAGCTALPRPAGGQSFSGADQRRPECWAVARPAPFEIQRELQAMDILIQQLVNSLSVASVIILIGIGITDRKSVV